MYLTFSLFIVIRLSISILLFSYILQNKVEVHDTTKFSFFSAFFLFVLYTIELGKENNNRYHSKINSFLLFSFFRGQFYFRYSV